MKVYVITCGEYSSYEICAVTLDKEQAELLKIDYSDKWEEARIEEYDTDRYKIEVSEETKDTILRAFWWYRKNSIPLDKVKKVREELQKCVDMLSDDTLADLNTKTGLGMALEKIDKLIEESEE